MELSRKQLLTALQFVQAAPKRKRPTGYIDNDKGAEKRMALYEGSTAVGITYADQILQLSKSDQETVFAQAAIPVTSMDESFTTLTGFEGLLAAVKAYSSEFITLTCDSTGQLLMQSSNDRTTTRLTVQKFGPGSVPDLKGEPIRVALPASQFTSAIQQVAFAAGTDDNRELLKAVGLKQSHNQLALSAANGFVASLVKLSTPDVPELDGEFPRYANPDAQRLKALAEQFDDVVTLSFGAEQLDLEGKSQDGVSLFARLTCYSGNFPDIEEIIASASNSKLLKFTAKLDIALMKPAMRQMMLFKDDVIMTISKAETEGILLEGQDVERGTARYQYVTETEGELPLPLHLNKYLLSKLLNAVESKVASIEIYYPQVPTNSLNCITTPVVFRQPTLMDKHFTACLMPMAKT